MRSTALVFVFARTSLVAGETTCGQIKSLYSENQCCSNPNGAIDKDTFHAHGVCDPDNDVMGAPPIDEQKKIFRAYSTEYNVPFPRSAPYPGAPTKDTLLGFGAPCNGVTSPIDSAYVVSNQNQHPTYIYNSNPVNCTIVAGKSWGGNQLGWPVGAMAGALILQFGNMVVSEITQRGAFAEAMRTLVNEAYNNTYSVDPVMTGYFTNDVDWKNWWGVYKIVATTNTAQLPYGPNPSPESIITTGRTDETWTNNGGGVCEDALGEHLDGVSDTFIENNVGNAYAYEWEQETATTLNTRLYRQFKIHFTLTKFARYDADAAYLVSDFTHLKNMTGKYTDAKYKAGPSQVVGTYGEVVIRDLPMLIVKHIKDSPNAKFQVVGIVMHRHDEGKYDVYTPEDTCPGTWKLAKMQFNAVYHTFAAISHFYQTHYWPHTGVGVAAHRSLNAAHPIRKLLYPNAWRDIGIAWVGFVNVFDKTGLFTTAATITGEEITEYIFPWMAKQSKYHNAMADDSFANITDDVRKDLPVYVWQKRYEEAFSSYANSFIDNLYDSDDDVEGDDELVNFKNDLVVKANYNEYGFLPASTFESKQKLKEWLGWVLMSQGFKHHLMNHRTMRDMLWCFPHRLPSLTKRFDSVSLQTFQVFYKGLPDPNESNECPVNVNEVSKHTTYTGLLEAAQRVNFGVDPATTAVNEFVDRLHGAAESFSPNFFEIPDLLASGYSNGVYDYATQRMSDAFASTVAEIEKDIVEKYSSKTLYQGAFKWTPMYGTPTQPTI